MRTYIDNYLKGKRIKCPSLKTLDWLNGYKKMDTKHIYASYKRLISELHTKSEEMEKIFHTNGNQKKAAVTILVSDKIDFKINPITKEKEGRYIMIKQSF